MRAVPKTTPPTQLTRSLWPTLYFCPPLNPDHDNTRHKPTGVTLGRPPRPCSPPAHPRPGFQTSQLTLGKPYRPGRRHPRLHRASPHPGHPPQCRPWPSLFLFSSRPLVSLGSLVGAWEGQQIDAGLAPSLRAKQSDHQLAPRSSSRRLGLSGDSALCWSMCVSVCVCV